MTRSPFDPNALCQPPAILDAALRSLAQSGGWAMPGEPMPAPLNAADAILLCASVLRTGNASSVEMRLVSQRLEEIALKVRCMWQAARDDDARKVVRLPVRPRVAGPGPESAA